MRRAWLLAGFVGVACVVPSFDVEPAASEDGGTTSGAGKSGAGGKSGAAGGGHAGTGADAAGSSSDPSGEGGAGGLGDPQTGGAGNTGAPYRVGFSIFSDSASGSDHAAGSKTDATFAKPVGTEAGDLLFVFFGSDHTLKLDGAELEADGWTLLDQHGEQGEDGQGTYLVYKLADGSEPDPIVFSAINDAQYTNGVQGLLSVYRGVDTTAPINGYDVETVDLGSDTSVHVETPTPAITTSVANCLLIAGLSPDSAIDAPLISSWPEGFSDNPMSVTNPPNPYPDGWANIYSIERDMPDAGTLPASYFGWEITNGSKLYFGALSFIVALAPVPR